MCVTIPFVYQVDREGAINWVLSLQAHANNEFDLNNGMLSLIKKTYDCLLASTTNVCGSG